ncbi:hypothetical protein OG216_32750 [Streptomycetaceae bacterium NBC_01309]
MRSSSAQFAFDGVTPQPLFGVRLDATSVERLVTIIDGGLPGTAVHLSTKRGDGTVVTAGDLAALRTELLRYPGDVDVLDNLTVRTAGQRSSVRVVVGRTAGATVEVRTVNGATGRCLYDDIVQFLRERQTARRVTRPWSRRRRRVTTAATVLATAFVGLVAVVLQMTGAVV